MTSSGITDDGEYYGDRESGVRTEVAAALQRVLDSVRSAEEERRIEAARDIRRLTKTSSENRRMLSEAIEPLVSMLRSGIAECGEAAILALLNLAVKDKRNKTKIVDAGALDPLIGFLCSSDRNLQEYSTAALLTLSASSANKPIIGSSGSIPLLVRILRLGNSQAKADALMALYNLSTVPENLDSILSTRPVPMLIELLNTCKKSSKTAEKCVALLELLLAFDVGRNALTSVQGGMLAIVEVLEEGSRKGREHAVGALLTMCESDVIRYREAILEEGAIPGLLELTVQGTPKAQSESRILLRLLRKSHCRRSELKADALENVIYNIVSRIDGDDRTEKAKKMVAEMVQVSMEQSLRQLQQRALVCTPSDVFLK